MSYLDELNESQRVAVINYKGPALVIAGAGSGKTKVLTYRIAHLLYNKIPPYKILALTFTNKAAKEMKTRIASIVGEKVAKYLWMGTFHSIFAKILRQEAALLNYPSNFTIYDSADSKSLIKSIVKEMHLDEKMYKLGDVLGKISRAKNNLISAKMYANSPELIQNDTNSKLPEIAKIYIHYTNRCHKAGAMDFDDLLLNTNFLFRDFPEVLEKYKSKFDYILVDEYQDTNFSQYLIVKKLSENHRNICVVGDDAQSIYSFRGAKIENILNFRNDYKDYALFKLEQNYRSTKTIVEAANSVIAKNSRQIPKRVFTVNPIGEKIKITRALTDYEESIIVVQNIQDKRMNNHYKFMDFAILYRTNMQSRVFEEAFRKQNIPYKIYGGISFYQRKEIKDVMAYFRLIINPIDDEAFKRIVNYPKRGLGDTSIQKIEQLAVANNLSMWDFVCRLNEFKHGLSSRTTSPLKNFVELISSLKNELYKIEAYDFAKKVTAISGVLKELHNDKAPEGISRYENVQELLNGIKDFSVNYKEENGKIATLDIYMEDVALLTGDEDKDDNNNDKVILMTIHSSKGLEFKNVYLVGLEENLFPSQMSKNSRSDLEEERRLFYVGITRAEQNLMSSHASTRYRWGNLTDCTISRFIDDIDPDFIEYTNDQQPAFNWGFKQQPEEFKPAFTRQKFQTNIPENLYSPNKIQRKAEKKVEKVPPISINSNSIKRLQTTEINSTTKPVLQFSKDNEEIVEGIMVEHQRFGVGKVLEIIGNAPNTKATIEFKSVGVKQLFLKFAKLKVVKTSN